MQGNWGLYRKTHSVLANAYGTPSGFTIWAKAADSLPPTVTMDVNTSGANTAVLIIDSADAMPDTGVLGSGGTIPDTLLNVGRLCYFSPAAASARFNP